jgi:hypothetical protein
VMGMIPQGSNPSSLRCPDRRPPIEFCGQAAI